MCFHSRYLSGGIFVNMEPRSLSKCQWATSVPCWVEWRAVPQRVCSHQLMERQNPDPVSQVIMCLCENYNINTTANTNNFVLCFGRMQGLAKPFKSFQRSRIQQVCVAVRSVSTIFSCLQCIKGKWNDDIWYETIALGFTLCYRYTWVTGKEPLTYYDMNLSAQDHQTFFTGDTQQLRPEDAGELHRNWNVD